MSEEPVTAEKRARVIYELRDEFEVKALLEQSGMSNQLTTIKLVDLTCLKKCSYPNIFGLLKTELVYCRSLKV